MVSAVRLREDYSGGVWCADEGRKIVNQSRRLLSLAAAAAKIGGMDREMLRDWVHRFNAARPGGPR